MIFDLSISTAIHYGKAERLDGAAVNWADVLLFLGGVTSFTLMFVNNPMYYPVDIYTSTYTMTHLWGRDQPAGAALLLVIA